jgi:hypothetical protein
MNLDREQFCTGCGDPTGRAGNFHDSLYVMIGEEKKGPLCDGCADRLSKENETEIIYE